jgi:hypothetical protein
MCALYVLKIGIVVVITSAIRRKRNEFVVV